MLRGAVYFVDTV